MFVRQKKLPEAQRTQLGTPGSDKNEQRKSAKLP